MRRFRSLELIRVIDGKSQTPDHYFGEYIVMLTCACGHARRCYPKTFAAFAGWDAKANRRRKAPQGQ